MGSLSADCALHPHHLAAAVLERVFQRAGWALPTSGLIQPIAAEAADPLRLLDFLQGILISVSQVFVKGDGIAALLILIGLAVGSIAAAGYALAAALISVVVAHLLGVESQLITAGLVGFNPILTAIAVGTVFARPGLRSALYALLRPSSRSSCKARWSPP